MKRNFTLSLIALLFLMLKFASAQPPQIGPAIGPPVTPGQPSYFEWTEDIERDIDGNPILDVNMKQIPVWYARVSPDLYDKLIKTGLNTTEGTDASRPKLQTPDPGANTLMLGGNKYSFAGSQGQVRLGGNTEVWVLKFKRFATFNGNWDTYGGRCPMKLTQTGDTVTGTYTLDVGQLRLYCTLTGTIADGKLTGEYLQPGYPDNKLWERGTFEFTLDQDGNRFSGWGKNFDESVTQDWIGTRKPDNAP